MLIRGQAGRAISGIRHLRRQWLAEALRLRSPGHPDRPVFLGKPEATALYRRNWGSRVPWLTNVVFKQAPDELLTKPPRFDDGRENIRFRYLAHAYTDEVQPENTAVQSITFGTICRHDASRNPTTRCAGRDHLSGRCWAGTGRRRGGAAAQTRRHRRRPFRDPAGAPAALRHHRCRPVGTRAAESRHALGRVRHPHEFRHPLAAAVLSGRRRVDPARV